MHTFFWIWFTVSLFGVAGVGAFFAYQYFQVKRRQRSIAESLKAIDSAMVDILTGRSGK